MIKWLFIIKAIKNFKKSFFKPERLMPGGDILSFYLNKLLS